MRSPAGQPLPGDASIPWKERTNVRWAYAAPPQMGGHIPIHHKFATTFLFQSGPGNTEICGVDLRYSCTECEEGIERSGFFLEWKRDSLGLSGRETEIERQRSAVPGQRVCVPHFPVISSQILQSPRRNDFMACPWIG